MINYNYQLYQINLFFPNSIQLSQKIIKISYEENYEIDFNKSNQILKNEKIRKKSYNEKSNKDNSELNISPINEFLKPINIIYDNDKINLYEEKEYSQESTSNNIKKYFEEYLLECFV